MSGRTSTASKRKYNDKSYDRIGLFIPKGQKDAIKAHAESQGESVNAFVQRAIAEAMERDKTK